MEIQLYMIGILIII